MILISISDLPLVAYNIGFLRTVGWLWAGHMNGLGLEMPQDAVIFTMLSAVNGFRTSPGVAGTILHSRCQGKQA